MRVLISMNVDKNKKMGNGSKDNRRATVI